MVRRDRGRRCGRVSQSNDAEAICEAVTRPTMRFVPVKSAERQAALLEHKTRDFLVRQQTQTVNTIRARLAEFGIVVGKGIHGEEDQKTAWGAVFPTNDRLLEAAGQAPEAAQPARDLLADPLRDLRERIETVTKRIEAARDRPTRSPAVSPGSARSRLEPSAGRFAAVRGTGVHSPASP